MPQEVSHILEMGMELWTTLWCREVDNVSSSSSSSSLPSASSSSSSSSAAAGSHDNNDNTTTSNNHNNNHNTTSKEKVQTAGTIQTWGRTKGHERGLFLEALWWLLHKVECSDLPQRFCNIYTF